MPPETVDLAERLLLRDPDPAPLPAEVGAIPFDESSVQSLAQARCQTRKGFSKGHGQARDQRTGKRSDAKGAVGDGRRVRICKWVAQHRAVALHLKSPPRSVVMRRVSTQCQLSDSCCTALSRMSSRISEQEEEDINVLGRRRRYRGRRASRP